LSSVDENAGHPTEPATLFLTITTSASASSSLTAAVNTPDPATANLDNLVAEGGAAGPQATVQVYSETMQPTAVAAPQSPLSRPRDLPVEDGTPVEPVDSQTRELETALRHAKEAINTMETWHGAVKIVKQVMDIVSPIAEVCPMSLLSMLR
jgi:hypothetical protein